MIYEILLQSFPRVGGVKQGRFLPWGLRQGCLEIESLLGRYRRVQKGTGMVLLLLFDKTLKLVAQHWQLNNLLSGVLLHAESLGHVEVYGVSLLICLLELLGHRQGLAVGVQEARFDLKLYYILFLRL